MSSVNRSVAKLRATVHPWLATERGVQKILNGILFLGFLLRVGVAFFTHLPHMDRDSFDYFHQADVLLAGGYINYFPNGYPLIIALFKAISADHVITLILSMNILLSTLTIYFVYDIGRKVFQRASIGLVAAFIVAVLPTQLNYSRWVMTEIPTACLLLGGYYFYYRGKTWLSGLFLGVATVIRTDELPIFVLLILLAAIWEKKFHFRLLAGALIPILLVGSYCALKTGSFSIAGHSRINIMYSITASGGYVDWYYQDNHPEVTTTAQAEKLYIDHARADPGGFVKQKLANLWEQWGFFPSSANRGTASRLGIGLENVFMVILGLYGWWKNRRRFKVFILILPFAIAVPLHVIFLALPRYTYPVEPFLILLATWTLYHVFAPREPA